MKISTIAQSATGLLICASFVAGITGCSSPRKHSDAGTATASARVQAPAPMVTTSDVPASDTGMKTRKASKSPANLGAASSGQGL